MKQPYENLPKVWAWSNDKKVGDDLREIKLCPDYLKSVGVEVE